VADVTQVIETQLKVIDQAAGPLGKIAGQAERAEKALAHAKEKGESWSDTLYAGLREVAGIAGVVGGALAFKGAWESSEKYLKNLKEVHELTGATVQETDFLFSSARKAGVEYADMNRIMFSLSRRGSMLEQTMAAAHGKVPGMAQKFQQMGVDMQHGPVRALTSMSEAVKKGKIDTADLMAQFRIPPGAVNDFKSFLETIDESTLAKIAKGEKVPGLVQSEDLKNFNRMEEAQHRINDAWNRIKVLIASKLLPVVANVAEKFSDTLENVLPKAQAFAAFLANRMDYIVGAAKVFVAVMTAKKMMQLATDLTSPGGFIGKLGAGGLGGLFKGLKGALPGALGGAAGGAGIMGQLSAIFAGFTAALPVLAAVAAVVGLVVLGFRAFEKNINGIGDRISLVWDTIKARFELMWGTIDGLGQTIMRLFGPGAGGILDLIGYIAALSFEKVLVGLDIAIHTIQTILSMGGELADMMQFIWKDVLADGWKEYVQDPFMRSMKWIAEGVGKVVDFLVDQYNTISKFWGGEAIKKGGFKFDFGYLEEPIKLFKKHWDLTEKATSKQVALDREMARVPTRETPSSRPPATNFDFRGSRFDITQNFAEGFDPDRIAVAFSNDLASLGEMRTQSGLAPAFAAR